MIKYDIYTYLLIDYLIFTRHNMYDIKWKLFL